VSLRRNALLLALATALLAILGLWSAGGALARLWRIPAGLLLLGLAYEAWQATRAAPSLQIQTAQRWFLARPAALRLLLTHAQRRTLEMQIAPAAPPQVAMDRAVRAVRVPPAAVPAARPHSEEAGGDAASGAGAGIGAGIGTGIGASTGAGAVLELTGTARRLGEFGWPAMPVRVGGVLGLAWWSQRLAPSGRVQVVPDVLRSAAAARGAGSRAARSALRLGAGAQVLQLRDYQRGDALRVLDWKASARRGRLISRDYSEDQHLEIVLALDAGRASGLAAGDTDRLALYANVAARFAQRAVALDDAVGLVVYAERPLAAVPPARGTAAVARLRECLTLARVHGADGNAALAALQARSLVRRRSLVIFLTDLDEPSALEELAAAARLLLPKHLPFIAGVESEGAQRLAIAAVSDDVQAYRALAAQEYRASVVRNVQALRALGAAALLARPSLLEEAVLSAYVQFRQRRRVG
jgi:uncharacterized protein (DUF58 family)